MKYKMIDTFGEVVDEFEAENDDRAEEILNEEKQFYCEPVRLIRGVSMDRSKINQALSKAIAYKNCGKEDDARFWGKELLRLLDLADIIKV